MNDPGPWRDGEQLVIGEQSMLPMRCLYTGRPTDTEAFLRLTWEPWWSWLCIFIPYAGYMVTRMAATPVSLTVPIADNELRRQNRKRVGCCISLGFGLILIPIGLVLGIKRPLFLSLLAIGPIITIAALIMLVSPRGKIRVTRIHGDREFVWLAGVSPDILFDLPNWPDHLIDPRAEAIGKG